MLVATKEGKLDYVWATSWGRFYPIDGSTIMTHSDDNGLVLPPKLAPIHVAIVPIYKTEEQRIAIALWPRSKRTLKSKSISVTFGNRDNFKPGYKFNEYEIKGVPLRIAIGPRDLENKQVELARRYIRKNNPSLDSVDHIPPL